MKSKIGSFTIEWETGIHRQCLALAGNDRYYLTSECRVEILSATERLSPLLGNIWRNKYLL